MFICSMGVFSLLHLWYILFNTDLITLVNSWKLPVVRLLSQVVKVTVGQLSAFSGNLYSETSGNATGALTVDQSESLKVPWRKD